jgi:predicted lipoprotein with Yx(FWY)xxD motif
MQRAALLAGSVFALTLAACGGGGSTSAPGAPATTSATATPTTAPTNPPSSSSPSGTLLVTTLASGNQSAGFTLYTLSDDTTTSLACTVASGCTGLWIPYSSGATVADESASGLSSGISVFSRSDNSALQWALTVNGVAHPLYTYAGDAQAGVATGVGIVSFGGTWAAPTPPPAGSATVSGEPDAGMLATATPGPTATPGSPYIHSRNPL